MEGESSWVNADPQPSAQLRPDKELSDKDMTNRQELRVFGSEKFGQARDTLEQTLDRARIAFDRINYVNSQSEGLRSQAFEKISAALKEGALTTAQETLAQLEQKKEDYQVGTDLRNVRDAALYEVNKFLGEYNLRDHVVLTGHMSSDEIKRAIDLGFEAKMWELTNDFKD